MSTAIQTHEWITHIEAMRRLAVGRPALLNLIAQGLLTSRTVPGSRPCVLAADVDSLAERCTRRATANREAAPCA